MDNNAVSLAALGVVATCVACLVWVVKKVLTDVVPAIQSLDTYLRERNGRDNEQHVENIEMQKSMVRGIEKQTEAIQVLPDTIQKIADASADKIIASQQVAEQTVGHQTILKKE